MTVRTTYLGNRNASSRALADLTDLGASTANDTADHVRRNANVLRHDFFAILVVGRRTAGGSIRIRAAVVLAWCTVAEVGTIAGTHNTIGIILASLTLLAISIVTIASQGCVAARLGAHDRVVEHGAGSAFPVIDKALADLPDGALDALRSTLHLNYPLRRLGQHLLLRNHTDT